MSTLHLFVRCAPVIVCLATPVRSQEAPVRGTGMLEIRGIVVDEAQRPIAGARLEFVWYHSEPPRAQSDAQGRFTFRLPRNGPTSWFDSIPIRAEADNGRLLGFARVEAEMKNPDPITIVVKPPHLVTVRVVDAQGKPLPDARVEISEQETSLAEGTTGDDGACRIPIPADARVYWILALKDGAGFDYFENSPTAPPIADARLAPPRDVTLTLGGALEAAARVLDTNGEPLEDVELGPWWIEKPNKLEDVNARWSRICRVVSDRQRLARFRWIPADMTAGRTFYIRVADPRFWSRTRCIFDPKDPDRDLSTTAERRTLISGRVLDPQKRPAAGVLLLAEGHAFRYASLRYLATTEDDGTYLLEIPSNWHTMLTVAEPEWAAPTRAALSPTEDRAEGNADFTLSRGTLVRGTVTDSNTGKPLPNALMQLREQGEPFSEGFQEQYQSQDEEYLIRHARTDEQGRYRFRVGPGKYQLVPEGQYFTFGLPQDDERLLVVKEGDAELERNFAIEPPGVPRILAGRVIDAAGKPVADALVIGRGKNIYTSTSNSSFSARTDNDGRFRAKWSGNETLVWAKTKDPLHTAAIEVPTSQAGDIALQLGPPASVRGRILDSEGMPLANETVHCEWGLAPVSFGANRGSFYSTTTTDADGRFELKELPPGAHGMIYLLQAGPTPDAPSSLAQGPTFEASGSEPVELDEFRARFPTLDP